MENKLNKRYGLPMAIAMVIGIVIGSGVFFKAETVLKATGGNVPMGIAAWAIVGLIMIICSYTFAVMAASYEKVNGVVDYAEVFVGKKYGYFVGWFMATIYQPAITSVLAWVSARYTCVLIGWDITGGSCMVIAGLFLVGSYALNALSPILAGRWQVSSTVIKLIPLTLMAVVGTIKGLSSGMTASNFSAVTESTGIASGLFASVVAVAFAYEGWIVATSINAELRDSKRTLPRALILGSLIVVAVYILYYIGLAGVVTTDTLMAGGEAGAKNAFMSVFGQAAGTLIFIFVIISCLGTLNGLMVGTTRAFYSLAARGVGPRPEILGQVDPATNMPSNSSIVGLLMSALWLVYFYGANLTASWFGAFSFDSSELPIVALYGLYIPILVLMMMKEKGHTTFKRFVMPALSIFCCAFMLLAAILAHGMAVLYFVIISVVIMIVGWLFSTAKAPAR